jgi:hypothetical protein
LGSYHSRFSDLTLRSCPGAHLLSAAPPLFFLNFCFSKLDPPLFARLEQAATQRTYFSFGNEVLVNAATSAFVLYKIITLLGNV